MAEQIEPFVQHGTSEDLVEVPADDILNAIAEGRGIDVEYAVIDGDLDIMSVADQLEENEDGDWIVKEDVRIADSEIRDGLDFSLVAFAGRVVFPSSVFNAQVAFSSVTFNAEANFSSAVFNAEVNFSSVTFAQKGSFSSATFNGPALFLSTIFNKAAIFSSSTFNELANFYGTLFEDHVSFLLASFSKSVFFWEVSFNPATDFKGAVLNQPASFMDVSFREKTVFVGLWNDVLCPTVKFITAGKVVPQKKIVTHFLSMDTDTVMDGSSPYLKRYINDEQWIEAWRNRGNGRNFIFFFWELMSHCGRSIGLWVAWSLFFVLVSTVTYTPAPGWMPEWWCNFWQQHGAAFEQTVSAYRGEPLNFWSCFYFSIVSFTTLGFGDIAASNSMARLLVTTQVIFGYVMLGGLISIFANKFARRS